MAENRNEIIEAYYRKHYKGLVSITSQSVPNKSKHLAEEVVQEAFTNALQYWDAFDPEKAKLQTWFARILRSCISRCIQAEGGGNQTSLNDDEMDLEPFILGDDFDIPVEIVVKIQDAIKAEPQARREILHMFFNLGMKPREIACIVNVSPLAVSKLVSRWRINWSDENIFVS